AAMVRFLDGAVAAAVRTTAEASARPAKEKGLLAQETVDEPAPAVVSKGIERLRDGEGRPVFFFPPAGGTNFGYYQLARHLSGTQPLYAVSFPAEQQHRLRTVRGLAEYFIEQIQQVQSTGPYRLAGY